MKCPVLSPGVRTHSSNAGKMSPAGPSYYRSFIGSCALLPASSHRRLRCGLAGERARSRQIDG